MTGCQDAPKQDQSATTSRGGAGTWRAQFVDALSPSDGSAVDVGRAQQLKDPYLPARLFRYRDINDHSLDNLLSDTQWMSNAASYNDPFDTLVSIDSGVLEAHVFKPDRDTLASLFAKDAPDPRTLEAIDKSPTPLIAAAEVALAQDGWAPNLIESTLQTIEQIVRDRMHEPTDAFAQAVQRNYCACSFSETYSSILMWSHYAGMHTGLCVEYDFSALEATHPKRLMLFPVLYGRQRIDATRMLSSRVQRHPMIGVLACLHKAEEWKYEREWRLIAPGISDSPKGFNTEMPKPSRVYIGARASDENRQAVEQICAGRAIPTSSMRLSRTEYRLEAK